MKLGRQMMQLKATSTLSFNLVAVEENNGRSKFLVSCNTFTILEIKD
jgi:hypothetical protein